MRYRHVGQKLEKDMPLYCVLDEATGTHSVTNYKSMEPCVVDDVRLIGEESDPYPQNAMIKLRYNRNPVIGDKFSSRHGQKVTSNQVACISYSIQPGSVESIVANGGHAILGVWDDT
jgi:hypothetical protein